MTNNSILKRKALRGGAALQALALLGAGLSTAAMFATPAAAQDYTNVNATGRVIGTNGQAISGATIELKSDDQGFTRNVTTDSSGAFRVPQIPAGRYTFTITASGFDTYTESAVTLGVANSANQFTLAAAGASAGGDIVVTAGRVSTPDFERTTTGTVVNVGDLATRVPVARSLRDVILLAPGTTQGSAGANAAFANQAQINGSSFTENAYYVNGLNITEVRSGFSPVTVPFDFYQSVEIKTGGFPAEFGRATGGVINAVTKSGTNDYHASILFNWEPDDLRSDIPNTYISDNDATRSDRKEMVAQLSGPIIKDRLFVYGIYSTRDVTSFGASNNATTAAGNTGTFQSTRSPFYGAKVDAVPIDGQHLEFTYFNTSGSTDIQSFRYNSATNTVGTFSAQTTNLYGGENYVGRYTGSFTKWLTVSAAYGKNNNRNITLPQDTVRPRVLDARSGTSSALPGTNSVSTITQDKDVREFYRGDVDLYFNILGSHHVRFGYDREDITSTRDQVPIAGGGITLNRVTNAAGVTLTGLPIGTDYIAQRFFTVGGAFKTRNEAYYIEDNWSLFGNRLQLQLGVRDDKFNLKNGLGQPFYVTDDQIGPRLGFSFDVFGDGKAKLFGSLGRNFTPVPSNTNLRSAGVQFDRTSYFVLNGIDANGVPIKGAPVLTYQGVRACPDTNVANCRLISSGSSKPPEAIVSSTLKSQYTDEAIIGAEYRVGSHLRFGLEGTYRKLGRAAEDAAIDQAAIKYCISKGFTSAACNNLYSGFSQYVIVNPGEPLTVKLYADGANIGLPDGTTPTVTFSAADIGAPNRPKRTYYGVTAKFDRDFDGKWSLSGSYTWSSLKGDYEGGAKSDIGQADTGITEDYDQPGFLLGAYGFLPGHRRHSFKLYGSYQLTDWLSLGANGQLQSPKKFGCLGIIPATIDPFANAYGPAGHFCQGKLVPRASVFESDWRKELNANIQIRVPADFDARVSFDVFNVFNTHSVLEADEVGDTAAGGVSPTYKAPIGYQNPRSVRIQLRVGF